MAAAQEGDKAAYERLLEDILPALRSFARRRLGDDVAAEDVVQEVLLSVHRARQTYRPERPFEPWLFAIARNAIIDFQRARTRRQREVVLEDDLLQSACAPTDPAHADAHDPRSELSPLLGEALAKLPEAQREAVLMIHVEGLSVIEAALRARVSPGALRVRAHRGYRALRALLGRPAP
ncbi:MAG TPA: sigma-70 family RNA polymerase sigma factor [Myxococcota bacterium]|nr:sigma-70 family RNA polymerase sigma factor [Myxococcota bacterium]